MDDLIAQTLALDLEVTRQDKQIRRIGAVFQGDTFQWSGRKGIEKALSDLDGFAGKASYILGHNIFNHDLPVLKGMAPGLKLLHLPVIDTLYLSPLAFPQNPYHRLVKDYKLVRSCLSDPLEDVRLALSVFKDQWESFSAQGEKNPGLLSFYGYCFRDSFFSGFSGAGLADVFGRLGAGPYADLAQALRVFRQWTEGIVCRHAVENSPANAPVLAYSLAWLRVAGSNSVLPPWVRHQFPEVVPFLKKLRDIPCGDGSCLYCRQIHDPDAQLKCFFGFDAFRGEPKTDNGQSLQRAVALHGLRDESLLAILPTGGGKSLCYQLPGLVRHMRRGLLTVVISPLQALMKDQVDNLVKNTGTPFAAAIYGLLTPPERGEVIERVRMGDIAVLYLSPEQLRSKSVREVLTQREIGCWVFDEAHCLSKWGHDFRPDYMYAARFIREFAQAQKLPLPPIACYTATAKPDVIEEIIGYFQTELKQPLALFEGGVERDNLSFDIVQARASEKLALSLDIVRRHLEQEAPGSIIVYAAKRKTTEQIQDYFVNKGVPAQAFHAGLDANEKRRIIEAFVADQIPVICATNAFGMGIDKHDIRLVLHFDIPGSLENYLQEAGRAGRDFKPAKCILLYDAADAETQFRLGAVSEIKKDEIQRILRCLKRSKRNQDNEVVITTQELLRDEDLTGVFEKTDRSADTKIRTAVSWLERADFLLRNQNLTQVFQGKPLVKNIEQAQAVVHGLPLSPLIRKLWLGIMGIVFNSSADHGLSADDIAESLFSSADTLNRLEKQFGLKPSQIVIYAMHDMAAAGLLDKGMMLSAFIKIKGNSSAAKVFNDLCVLEIGLLKFMQVEAPDASVGDWLDLDINRLNQRLQNDGYDTNPVVLRNLVKGLAYDGQGLAGSHGSIDLKHMGRNRYRLSLQRSWQAIVETAALRRNVASVIVRELVDKAKQMPSQSQNVAPKELLVKFSANDLAEAINHDITLYTNVQKPLAAIDRGLMFLHEHKIITLQHGLAVFRQAMTIRMNPAAKGRKYTIGDFKPLAVHYKERRFQVHVIMEYANLAMDRIARALELVLDYFAMPRDGFVRKYFAHREKMLERATGVESYRQIVERLNNPVQIEVVGSPVTANKLVMAGPGAGKTRVIVHRCAYLLRVERIAAGRILILCFNHGAAVSLRKRLNDLVGRDAYGVTVATYHGAAMRLTGVCLREIMEHQGAASPDFDLLIREAVALLKGEKEVPGMDPDEMRDHLLQGFSHILVDEYQDIDRDQYELVSAIAGRTLEQDAGRLSIMAVGDDDQNVYTFRGANVAFIQRFEKDYAAETVYLVENYRSSAHIINAANQLIIKNRDRIKTDHPIRINRQRNAEPQGGQWAALDPLGQGRVQRLLVQDPSHQAAAVCRELLRMRALKPSLSWDQCAVLARTNRALTPLRAIFEINDIPVMRSLQKGLPLHRIREVYNYLEALKACEDDIRPASELAGYLPQSHSPNPGDFWADMLTALHSAYQQETADAQLPVGYFIDWLYDALSEQQREKTIGRGVFLNTIHGAKGLEFDHVFILDGDWKMPPDRTRQEEERRLLYVGMTRAKETLCLLEMQTGANPFLQGLEGPCLLRRQAAAEDLGATDNLFRTYCIPGFQDIHLGFAGTFPAEHRIHKQLAELRVGDGLQVVAKNAAVMLQNQDGDDIAKMSNAWSRDWACKLDEIMETRILGMVQWSIHDGDETYRSLVKTEKWEFPLVEMVLKPPLITKL